MSAVNVNPKCRSCGAVTRRILNLPQGVSLPAEFTCARCTAGKSALDGLSEQQIAERKIGANDRRRAARNAVRLHRKSSGQPATFF